jgi:signal transduction histidine kinase
VNLAHFTPDGFNLTMAGWSLKQNHVPTGTRLRLDGDTINVIVQRIRAPARVATYDGVEGELAAALRELGIRSEVGAPVIVEDRVWGALIAGTDKPEPLPDGAETRVASFAEVIATAVSNAAARSDLIAARRRVIEASDSARRRLTRDLHDGAQQDLVNVLVNLQLAQEKWEDDPPGARELLGRAAEHAQVSIDELRDLAAGIHPEILANRGLAAAIEGLVERLPLPVKTDGLPEQRLAQEIEASVYFFVSEALTNVVKHAKAGSARVEAALEDERLTVEVSDNGVGGAQPGTEGTGLIGLGDRMAALDGRLTLRSKPGEGTTLHAVIPLGSDSESVDSPK